MKKFIFFMFTVFCNVDARAQPNLIANPSFEIIDTCLGGYLALTDINYFNWYSFSSADIYTNCALSGYYVPQNQFGFQYPVSGNNYAGIQTYASFSNLFYDYITGIISINLNSGRTYCSSIHVSLMDTLNTACNSIGIGFTQNIPTTNFGGQLSAIVPQIQNNASQNPLTSHDNWTIVKGSFIANGNEKFITIGNFLSNIQSDTTNLPNPVVTSVTNQSYYYLDDVSLIELKALHSPDTLVCAQTNFNQTLKAYPGFDSYLWSTGDTTRIINITQPGQYWVTASNWCGTITDTIQVNVFNTFGFDQMLGIDKALCDYQFPQRLRPLPQYENTFFNYQWSNGSDTSFADVLLPGTYYLTAEHLCGFVTDSISLTLNPNPTVNLGNDTILCIGQNITLNAGLQSTYTWSNQSTAPSITVNETGLYSVTVTNQFNCIANDEIQINFTQEYATLLPNDTALYASEFPFIVNLFNNYSNYQSNQLSIINSQLSIQQEGTYILSATDANGCLVSDSITISLKELKLIIPTILKKDQAFFIHNLPANSSLKVFDALGQIVYQNTNYQNNFMPLVANAMYFVELEYVVDNQNKKYDGKLLVLE